MSTSSRSKDMVFETETLFPRAWFKMEDGFSLGSKFDNVSDGDIEDAFNKLTPETEYEVYRLHRYRNGEIADHPSEVIFRAREDEDFTTWAYSINEPSLTTDITDRLDDRRDHLPVTIQSTQGTDRAYGYKNNFSEESRRTLGEIEGLEGDILRGRDDESWELEQETGAWTSKMDGSLINWYNETPRGVDIVEEASQFADEDSIDDLRQVAVYLDNFRDTIDVIVEDYESEADAWEDVRERNYDEMATHLDGISSEGLERMLEELPSQMETLTDVIYRD